MGFIENWAVYLLRLIREKVSLIYVLTDFFLNPAEEVFVPVKFNKNVVFFDRHYHGHK